MAETPEELTVRTDFRNTIWSVFQELYEDKWDQERWNVAVARFRDRHDPALVALFWGRARLPPWDALAEKFRKGPPPFLRPGWKSPLLGQKVDLEWLDTGTFEHVQGDMNGWRDAKLLVIEMWASWCRPCLAVFRNLSTLAQTRPEIKVITFNSESIFANQCIDVAAVKAFVAARDDMKYPIYIDTERVAVKAIFHPGQNLSIPLVFILSPKDRIVRWIGNPEEMDQPLEDALLAVQNL